jgi:hypothetical protein
MPELKPHPYEHRRPRRPRYLPRRTQPPPERPDPPDLRWLLYIGFGLAALLAAVAFPYLVSYLVQAITGG